jgi:hypothetical protein
LKLELDQELIEWTLCLGKAGPIILGLVETTRRSTSTENQPKENFELVEWHLLLLLSCVLLLPLPSSSSSTTLCSRAVVLRRLQAVLDCSSSVVLVLHLQ